jgi:hypothetical protein
MNESKVFHFHGPHLSMTSGSVQIRGNQIASYFEGSTVDNLSYSDGTNIYIKVIPCNFIPDNCYCDIVDNSKLLNWISESPQVKVIVISKLGFNYVKKYIRSTRIKLIPQHHCNKENFIRPDRPIKVVGFVGSEVSCQISFQLLERGFSNVGLDFIWLLPPFILDQVVEFYRKIDIQIVYRIWDIEDKNINLKDGLKLFNAGSFGIPTVSTSEPGYNEEFKGIYLEVKSLRELIEKCILLKRNRNFYQELSRKVLSKSKSHHIDRIIPLYKELLNNGG